MFKKSIFILLLSTSLHSKPKQVQNPSEIAAYFRNFDTVFQRTTLADLQSKASKKTSKGTIQAKPTEEPKAPKTPKIPADAPPEVKIQLAEIEYQFPDDPYDYYPYQTPPPIYQPGNLGKFLPP